MLQNFTIRLTRCKFIVYDIPMSDDKDIDIELLAKLIGNKYQYLMVIYDVEYNHFIIEILNPYGETIATGLGPTLKDSIKDILKEIS